MTNFMIFIFYMAFKTANAFLICDAILKFSIDMWSSSVDQRWIRRKAKNVLGMKKIFLTWKKRVQI